MSKIKKWEIRDNDKDYIPCIGIDRKQHICYPWEDKCYCGVPVLRKKVLKNDWEKGSCYECTY